MRQPIIAGNWKLHGSREFVARYAEQIVAAGTASFASVQLVLFPPAPYIHQLSMALADTGALCGSQDVSTESEGAFTGEVSAAMVFDQGGRLSIVGHSERRMRHGESDAVVAAKFQAAASAGLTPILCVGESLDSRDAGKADEVVSAQVQAALDVVGVAALETAVLAYEPIWAIGTGRTASPAQAQAMHAVMRKVVARADAGVAAGLRILYGGSVKPDNATALFSEPDIDGALVGGAALQAEGLLAIASCALVRTR